MKLTPQESRIAERMAPGVLCREGFLCADGRDLPEILDADAAAVAALGLTHEQIGLRLEEVLKAATAGLGAPVRVAAHLTACFRESMGRIPCPWGGCGVFPKGEVELADARTGRTVRFTPLSVHLVRRHGFYQGRCCRYRLEPAQLARLLDIHPPAG